MAVRGSRVAGQAGLPFAAGYHIAPTSVLETVAAYREAFRRRRGWSGRT